MGQPLFNSIAVVIVASLLAGAWAWFWFWKNAAVKKVERLRDMAEAEAKRLANEHAKLDERVREVETLKDNAIREAQRLAREHGELEERVREMEVAMGKMGATIVPITVAFQAILVKQLTHFHTPEMDALMAKLARVDDHDVIHPSTLTPDEDLRLAVLLEERSKDLNGRIDDSERDAAIMLPMVIRRVKDEARTLAAIEPKLQIVAVVPDDVNVTAHD